MTLSEPLVPEQYQEAEASHPLPGQPKVMIDNYLEAGNVTVTMCTITIPSRINQAIVRYEDGSVYVAYERPCGCIDLRPVRIVDLERLPLVEGQPDSYEEGGESEIAASSLRLAA